MTAGPDKSRWRKPGRLYEEIARNLADAIVHGRPKPGEFLPTEHDLVAEYGASRNIVREALKLVAARGLAETIHGRGTRVLPPDRWSQSDRLMLVQYDPQLPRDLFEMRSIVEVAAAGLAAERANSEKIAEMRDVVERTRMTTEPGESMRLDAQFHALLAASTGNALLPMLMDPVAGLLEAHREATIRNPGVLARSIEAHSAIVDCLEARDPECAKAAMRRHLEQVAVEVELMRSGPSVRSKNSS